jgi:dipeptidase D
MSTNIRELHPKELWNHFADLSAVPRGSRKEERASRFAADFGQRLGLETSVDELGNVLIRKPASPGHEKRPPLVLQGHLDMVHQKNSETVFDFDREGIRARVEGDWVKAEGTTLGADNGIGVAAAMAVLANKNLPHPPLEVLLTIDEEMGMTGANGLQPGWLKGRRLLNLDSEDDTELTIGCAGGLDILVRGSAPTVSAPPKHNFFEVSLAGLTGGHSGIDIHRGRGNANKLMNRLLMAAVNQVGAHICWIDGGGLRNVIPRESKAVVAVPQEGVALFAGLVESHRDLYSEEYRLTDPHLRLESCPVKAETEVMEEGFQSRLLAALYTVLSGIYRMSPAVPGLVQTSNNLARVLVRDGQLRVDCLTRSSVDTEKRDLAIGIRALFEMIGAQVQFEGEYTGWDPNPDSELVRKMTKLYRDVFGEEPKVLACHAGVECGIIGASHPGMEMISFGPNIRGAHSPDERVQISSVQRFWSFLTSALEKL